MSGKKKKKKNAGPPLPMVRLSQCMIVKNEEKNIERALGWAKRIAFEQIVVDTGSTDKTVELAEKLGAKVYHFEWINDFAAAKNYAIEQASGNWIAFLDADEYMTSVDAKKLMIYLRNILSDSEMKQKYLALNCKWSQVNDEGRPFALHNQERVFRNLPTVRYTGRIHEHLTLVSDDIARAEELTIIHTGYSDTAYEDTKKSERNIELLRAEQQEKPDDENIMIYLADSLVISEYEEKVAEGEELYWQVINNGVNVNPTLLKGAYLYFLERLSKNDEKLSEFEALSQKAIGLRPHDMDYLYYQAIALKKKGKDREAWEQFKLVEEKLIGASSLDVARTVTTRPEELFGWMLHTANSLGDVEGVVRYAAIILSAHKDQYGVLGPYIQTLLRNGTTEDEVVTLLSKVYDMNDPNDLLAIARTAKDFGAIDLARRVIGMIKAV